MTLQIIMITAMILFSLGVYGVLSRKDILRIVISVTIMLGSITLIAIVLAQMQTTPETMAMMYSFVLFTWVIEVIEVLIALALFLVLAKRGTTDVTLLEQMKW